MHSQFACCSRSFSSSQTQTQTHFHLFQAFLLSGPPFLSPHESTSHHAQCMKLKYMDRVHVGALHALCGAVNSNPCHACSNNPGTWDPFSKHSLSGPLSLPLFCHSISQRGLAHCLSNMSRVTRGSCLVLLLLPLRVRDVRGLMSSLVRSLLGWQGHSGSCCRSTRTWSSWVGPAGVAQGSGRWLDVVS